jgi:hypothetical protein
MLFPNAKHASSVLFRIVAALLIAVPAFLILVLVFALAGRRRTSPRRLMIKSPFFLERGSGTRMSNPRPVPARAA